MTAVGSKIVSRAQKTKLIAAILDQHTTLFLQKLILTIDGLPKADIFS